MLSRKMQKVDLRLYISDLYIIMNKKREEQLARREVNS